MPSSQDHVRTGLEANSDLDLIYSALGSDRQRLAERVESGELTAGQFLQDAVAAVLVSPEIPTFSKSSFIRMTVAIGQELFPQEYVIEGKVALNYAKLLSLYRTDPHQYAEYMSILGSIAALGTDLDSRLVDINLNHDEEAQEIWNQGMQNLLVRLQEVGIYTFLKMKKHPQAVELIKTDRIEAMARFLYGEDAYLRATGVAA